MSKTDVVIIQSFEIAWESDSELGNCFSVPFYETSISMTMHLLCLLCCSRISEAEVEIAFPSFSLLQRAETMK